LGAWFFITLAPTSSIIPIATEVGAERRMYLPLMALVVAGVLAGRQIWRVLGRTARDGVQLTTKATASVAAWLLFVALSSALGAATMIRNREYASGVRMAETMVARQPSSHTQHILGQELMAAGRHDEAM